MVTSDACSISGNEREAALARYAAEVFRNADTVNSSDYVGAFLAQRLNSKYTSTAGGSVITDAGRDSLYNDYCRSYGSIVPMTYTRFQMASSLDFLTVCALGLFAGIPPEELSCVKDVTHGRQAKRRR